MSFSSTSSTLSENPNNTLGYLSPSNHANTNSKIFSVEGNIGSGKSTLLRLIQGLVEDTQVVREPVNNWQAIDGNPQLNLLDAFYQNPHRWGYTFQVYAYFSRLKQWHEIRREKPFVVCERSVLSDKFIFALNGHKAGFFNELEWALYNDYFNFLVDKFHANQMDGIIYLHVQPEICYKRLQKRARDEEKDSISLEYLKDIHQRHEDWLITSKECLQEKIPILVIDGNTEFEQDGPKQREIISQITRFLQQNKSKITA
ncbi:hypothetical protein ABPG74_022072 [Tetrahymena malaccensis]